MATASEHSMLQQFCQFTDQRVVVEQNNHSNQNVFKNIYINVKLNMNETQQIACNIHLAYDDMDDNSYHPGLVRIERPPQAIVNGRLTSIKPRQQTRLSVCAANVKENPVRYNRNTLCEHLVMWHNTNDRETSAQQKKIKNDIKNILISFAVSKLSESEKQLGKMCQQGADKHNYFQFKSCSFKHFLNQEESY